VYTTPIMFTSLANCVEFVIAALNLPHSIRSIDALGVDIASFSSMPGEAEVVLLPGLPLMNHPGEESEPDMWTFEVATVDAAASSDAEFPKPMIDYVHPGWMEWVRKRTASSPSSPSSPSSDASDYTEEDDTDTEMRTVRSPYDDTEQEDTDIADEF